MSKSEEKKRKPGGLTWKQAAVAVTIFGVALGAAAYFNMKRPPEKGEESRETSEREPERPQVNSERLAQAVRSADEATAEAALRKIRETCAIDPEQGALYLQNKWGKALLDARRYQDLADLAFMCAMENPDRTDLTCSMLRLRTLAFMGLGQHKEALGAAKSMWNLLPLDRANDALYLIGICLMRAHPEDPEIYARFKKEQQAGARDGVPSALMSGITVDAKLYEDWLVVPVIVPGEPPRVLEWHRYMNIALISDQPKEARRALAMIRPQGDRLVEMTAQVLKAEEGVVGGANRFVEARMGSASTRPGRARISPMPWGSEKPMALTVPVAKLPVWGAAGAGTVRPDPGVTPARTVKLTVPLAKVPWTGAATRP